ncbi:YciI family protein [Helicobacter turcicus]|uniref:YciI family protein n=1 Tax=Helicobacter turcicus TaxID=2867412 RepID=A0ABS7JLN5_9HELI|nr:YciI family protein [Helicobacter turcicus]MBX7490281.1 YciI family protein [Helicobacter turcicus]MBX7545140.1 YciI family protein [Helicobacter turcicus]
MKNLFVILVTYTKPLDTIESILQDHRAFLKKGYESGHLLASGPQNPRVGGVIIGKFDSKESAETFFKYDPFAQNGAATYQVLEFTPVLHHEFLESFLKS